MEGLLSKPIHGGDPSIRQAKMVIEARPLSVPWSNA